MADQQRMDAATDAGPEEEDEHRRTGDQPRDGDRRKQERAEQRSPAKPPTLERQGREESERGRDRRSRAGDHEAIASRGEQRAVVRQDREPAQRRLDSQRVQIRSR